MNSPRIAFLGLGIMGGGMTRRLLGAGFSLSVHNRNPTRAAALGEAGARVAETPRAAAAGADLIFSMVADDAASRAVWLGEAGALAGVAPGAVLVECSTLTVGWVRELAEAAARRGCTLVDAPVAGSRDAAAAGELKFLVGGPDEALARIRPALEVMGKVVLHLGPTGSGATMKLINNFLAGVQVAAFGEALAWIERSGLERAQAIAMLTGGAVGSPVVKTIAARMEAADYTPHFYLRLMAKDLGYAIGEGGQVGVELATAAAALGRFRAAVAAGHGDSDMAAVVRPLQA
ncbi:MAG: NAD(P)-dependent oxidoreductase [Verrucomicrobia bacterium]|nr:NAD(P)-dependent oxidoreductase [Verrucomicrobiota bacterium]